MPFPPDAARKGGILITEDELKALGRTYCTACTVCTVVTQLVCLNEHVTAICTTLELYHSSPPTTPELRPLPHSAIARKGCMGVFRYQRIPGCILGMATVVCPACISQNKSSVTAQTLARACKHIRSVLMDLQLSRVFSLPAMFLYSLFLQAKANSQCQRSKSACRRFTRTSSGM